MAIAAVNAVFEPTAATATNQIIVRGPGDVNIDVYRGHAQITQDGSASSGTINYIDGVNALPFTPSFIQVFRYKPPAVGVVATLGTFVGTSGFAVGSVFALTQATYAGYGATAVVATISAGGVIATATVLNPGNGNYFATTGVNITPILGSGNSTGTCTITITATQTADTTATTIYPVSATSVSAVAFQYQNSASDTSNNLMSIGFVAYK